MPFERACMLGNGSGCCWALRMYPGNDPHAVELGLRAKKLTANECLPECGCTY